MYNNFDTQTLLNVNPVEMLPYMICLLVTHVVYLTRTVCCYSTSHTPGL